MSAHSQWKTVEANQVVLPENPHEVVTDGLYDCCCSVLCPGQVLGDVFAKKLKSRTLFTQIPLMCRGVCSILASFTLFYRTAASASSRPESVHQFLVFPLTKLQLQVIKTGALKAPLLCLVKVKHQLHLTFLSYLLICDCSVVLLSE